MVHPKQSTNGGDIRDQATASLVNTIALYKACGWDVHQLLSAAHSLWGHETDTCPPAPSVVSVEVMIMPDADVPMVLTEPVISSFREGLEYSIRRSVPNGTEWHVSALGQTAIIGMRPALTGAIELIFDDLNARKTPTENEVANT